MRTLSLHRILLPKGCTTQTPSENIIQWPCEAQHVTWCHFIAGTAQSHIFMCLTQGRCFHAVFPYQLRLEEAQITKQVVWQGHVFHFSLKAIHVKWIWQNYNGKFETHPPGTSRMQGTFKDKLLTKQCSSAQCSAVDFNSFQQNCCGAGGAGDFKGTKLEGSLDEYLNGRQGFISCLRPTWALQLPCLSVFRLLLRSAPTASRLYLQHPPHQ